MKKLILTILLVLFAGQAWGAIYYVSQSATNGYQIGVDTNNGTSKATPVLTVYKAYSLAALSGDTIIVNDGTYDMAAGGNPNAYFRLEKSLTVNPETYRGVTFKSDTGGGLVIYARSLAGQSASIGSIVIDAQGVGYGNGSLYYAPQGAGCSLTLTGISFANQKSYAFTCGTAQSYNLTMADLDVTGTDTTFHGIYINAVTGGTISIDDIDLSWASSSTVPTIGINITAGATAPVVTINNVKGSITNTGSGSGAAEGVRVFNVPNAVIDNCNITISGSNASSGHVGIKISAADTRSADGGIIRNSTVSLQAPTGYAIIIGDSVSTGTGTVNNGKIYNCIAQGLATGAIATPHGIVMGMGNSVLTTGGKVYQNKSYNFNPAYLAAKCGNTTKFYNNIASNSVVTPPEIGSTQILYSKGCTGTKWYNNTVALFGFNAYAFAARPHSDTTNNADVEYENNIVYTDSESAVFGTIAANNTTTFSNNNYDSPSTLNAAAFTYQANNYATFALWQAAGHDANSIFSNPKFRSTTDYQLQSSSPCINKGANVGLTTDFLGHAISGLPDIGAYEYYGSRGGGGFGGYNFNFSY